MDMIPPNVSQGADLALALLKASQDPDAAKFIENLKAQADEARIALTGAQEAQRDADQKLAQLASERSSFEADRTQFNDFRTSEIARMTAWEADLRGVQEGIAKQSREHTDWLSNTAADITAKMKAADEKAAALKDREDAVSDREEKVAADEARVNRKLSKFKEVEDA